MTSDDDVPDRRDAPPRAPAAVAAGTSPRAPVAVAAGIGVVAGLATSRLVPGTSGDALGDALYAVVVLLLVTLVAPRARLLVRASVALGLCWAVEIAQATGGPAVAVRAWPPLRYLLGTTFAWPDLLAYAAGVLVAAVLMRVLSVRWSGTRRPMTPRP